jgi:hypothetical protein
MSVTRGQVGTRVGRVALAVTTTSRREQQVQPTRHDVLLRPLTSTEPPYRRIASFPTYVEAQELVDWLADRRFAVERLSIVAQDLRFVERVTGRLGYGTAAVHGLLSGAAIGALLGFLFGLLSLVQPLVSGLILALWGLVIGAAAGALLGLLAHALSGGRRDFSAVGSLQAGQYDVISDEGVADEALRLLQARRSGR